MALNLIIAALLAASSPQDPAPTVLDDVVVEGVRRNEATSFAFVRAISATPFGSHTMAVWTGPLCLTIDNLPPERAESLTSRILGRVEYVGVEVAPAGCRSNVTVIFTAEGSTTATDLVRHNRTDLRPTSGSTQLDRASLARFSRDERAVRWWTVNIPVDAEKGGRVVALAGSSELIRGLGGSQQSGGPPVVEVRGIKPVGDNIQDALVQTIVIVDARLANGVSYASLGDYLAMVILTQVDPEADVSGVPTILNLFSDNPSVTELSRWDQDYLKALYETPVRWTNIRFQQEDIARRMVADTSARPRP